MLRFVSLVRVHEGTDLDAIVSAGTKMREEEADIQSGFVVAAWALCVPTVPLRLITPCS